jgi:hypothetical protein
MQTCRFVYLSVFDTVFINHILPAVARQKALRKRKTFAGLAQKKYPGENQTGEG